jgi:uncharacterized protein YndB with AHSA1/START domain
MAATNTLTPENGGNRKFCIARHRNAADMKRHEEKGLRTGLGIAADQLEALARTL